MRIINVCLLTSVLWTHSAAADDIIGVVRDQRQPIAGAYVQIVGIGGDRSTDSGQFRVHAPPGTVGKRVSVHVDKDNWSLVDPYDSFVVPADPVTNPVILIMRRSTPIATRSPDSSNN